MASTKEQASASPKREPKERASTNPKRELPTDEAVLLTKPEVAELLGVTTHWVWRAVALNYFPYVKVGKLVRFRRSDIEAYIKAGTQDGRNKDGE